MSENIEQVETVSQVETVESLESLESLEPTIELVVDETPTESPTETPDRPEIDSVQKRINKITADKYLEKGRADRLQAQLDKLQSPTQNDDASNIPNLANYEYDQEKYNSAMIDYKVNQAIVNREIENNQVSISTSFNERIQTFGKSDFAEKANTIPILPQGVASALMEDDKGVDIIYYLGQHLDVADKLASMSSSQALMEIGRLSGNLTSTKKNSQAPTPINNLKGSGSVVDTGPDTDMTMIEWMAKFG